MATAGESKDEDDKIEELDRKITELQLARRAVNEELAMIAMLEQECIDERNHLRSMQRDRIKLQQTDQRVMELESQLKQAKYENLKLSHRNTNLKQSLNEADKFSKEQKRKITELENMVTLSEGKVADVSAQAQSKTKDSIQVVELHMRLSKTTEELNETRQRLSDVQERLTVVEQVTAATQQRQLLECGISEELQLELTPQHQPTGNNGISYEKILDRHVFAWWRSG